MEKERVRIKAFVSAFISCRIKGGKFYENIKKDLSRGCRREKLPSDLLMFLTGERFAFFVLPKQIIEILDEYTDNGFLYHITRKKSIDSIKEKGLISRRNYVYLTDDTDFIINDGFKKRCSDLVILRIDAASLRKKHKLYYTDRNHEIITDAVEPEYIDFYSYVKR